MAGISVEYYARLERGNLSGVSGGVLDTLAGALQLDETQRAHLLDLARTARTSPNKQRRPRPQQVRPSVQRVLDAMVAAPAWIRNGRSDFLASNPLGHALYAPIFKDPIRPANTARFTFLDPQARALYADWTGSPTTWWGSCESRRAEIRTTAA